MKSLMRCLNGRHLAQPRGNRGGRISNRVDQMRFSISPARAGTTAPRPNRLSQASMTEKYDHANLDDLRQAMVDTVADDADRRQNSRTTSRRLFCGRFLWLCSTG
jgi:hypothetical protein